MSAVGAIFVGFLVLMLIGQVRDFLALRQALLLRERGLQLGGELEALRRRQILQALEMPSQ